MPHRFMIIVLITSLCGFHRAAIAGDHGFVDTGDVLDGVPVISELNVEALAAGKHQFYFRAGWRNTGQKIHIPIRILKGQQPGKKLLLTAAVHGDELNGIEVIHRLFDKLDANNLHGTLVGIPGVNQPGLEAGNRHFLGSNGGGSMVDPNRIFPGALNGGDAASLYIGQLWHKILKGNADIAIDLHTQTRGAAYPLFVFADFGNATAQQIAYSLMPDMIKNDPGQEGTLETAFMNEGVPAVTFELGQAKSWQHKMIMRAETGILNVMKGMGLLQGTVTKPLVPPYVGANYTNVYTVEGGLARLSVELRDAVAKGDHVATVLDPLGREIRRYYAPHDGRILSLATDPLREAGTMLVRILQ